MTTTDAKTKNGGGGEHTRFVDSEIKATGKPSPDADGGLAGMSGTAKDPYESMHLGREQARQIRNHLYRFVARPYIGFGAGLAALMMLSLFFNLYDLVFSCSFPWVYIAREPMGQDDLTSWPLTAFVVGTFAAFIAFGVMLLKAVAPAPNTDNSDNADIANNFGNNFPTSGGEIT